MQLNRQLLSDKYILDKYKELQEYGFNSRQVMSLLITRCWLKDNLYDPAGAYFDDLVIHCFQRLKALTPP